MATSEKSRVARKRVRLSAITCDHPTQQGLSRLDRDRHGPTYDTSRPARACALTRVASHSQIPCILANFEHFGLMWTPYPKRLHAIPVYSTQRTASPQIYLTPLYGTLSYHDQAGEAASPQFFGLRHLCKHRGAEGFIDLILKLEE
ncbi:hypothetical protein EDB86DRAFT_3081722 [Lactarius hatsudake]|nr:hypothetical protein EDB86DRAFT_3081722 [Lactarius hatsudake]